MFFQALTRHQSVRNLRGFLIRGSLEAPRTQSPAIISLFCQVHLSPKLLALECSELSGCHVKTQAR